MSTFEKIEQQGLIVRLYTTKEIRSLRRFGYVHYVNRRSLYAVLYVDQELTDSVVKELERQSYVRSVEISPLATVSTNYEGLFPKLVEEIKDQQEENGESSFFEQVAKKIQAELKERDAKA